MNVLILVSVLSCIAVALVITLCRGLLSGKRGMPVSVDWIEELSVERYQPMLRLLNSAEIHALRSKPGFTPDMEKKFRINRSQIFRGYLRCLEADFVRIVTATKMILVRSQHDRPDLGFLLLKTQLQFACSVAIVKAKLVLYRWGIDAGDVAEVVKVFDVARLELKSLIPAAAAISASARSSLGSGSNSASDLF
jgi:hypothetical protein